MKARIALAGLLGGITLFFWGFVSHVVTHLGDAAIQSVPLGSDQALLDAIKTTLPQDGMYLYPGIDMNGDQAAMDAWAERTKSNYRGIIVNVTRPYGSMTPNLVKEFTLDFLISLFAASLLCWTLPVTTGFTCRAGLVASLSAAVSFRTIQQWNWYDFPSKYTVGQLADALIGFTLVGIVIALIVKPRPAA